MPELPEIETITRNLRPELIGKSILSAEILWMRTLVTPTPIAFRKRICNQKIEDITRRAKYLHLHLSKDHLLFHLRMSGDLLVKKGAFMPGKHDRLILTLTDDISLIFNDTRKFGRVWLINNPWDLLGKLGPEPLDPNFTSQHLYDRLHTRHRSLKPLLLEQTFIAGLGNIYADEALHAAGLHPLTPSDSITTELSERLWHGIRKILLEGIHHNGSSIDRVYRGGGFQTYFRVYGRDGIPCRTCGTEIQRIIVGQRSTHFCPTCQPDRR